MIIGTGCDLVPIERLREACERTPSLSLRLFSPAELAGAQSRGSVVWQRLAGAFAAKEAALKALGTGLRGGAFREVEVAHNEMGQPELRLSGHAATTAAACGVRRWHLSISHAEGMAMATVIAEGGEGE